VKWPATPAQGAWGLRRPPAGGLISPASGGRSGEPELPSGHGETSSATLLSVEPLTSERDSSSERADAGAQAEAPAEAGAQAEAPVEAARAWVVAAPMSSVAAAAGAAAEALVGQVVDPLQPTPR
jgi:hypothetical protein